MRMRGWIAAAGLAAAACGGSKPGPAPTPVVQAPQILCPADVKVGSVTGTSQAVTFSAPTVTGGTTPVTTTCTRSSGDSFPLGATAVSCTANDATARQAACSFNVTLTGFSIAAMTYETVGDSLTEGENGVGARLSFVDAATSYPTKLQTLFDANFPGQGILVLNRGHSGDKVETTVDLIPVVLRRDNPQAVLILAGYNNLTDPCGPGRTNTPACKDAWEQQVPIGVRDCIRRTKESPAGIKFIFVSTLTPPGTGPKRIDAAAILEANRRIRQMIAQERATLVDTHAAFLGHEAEYVSIDGLHLNPAGYQAIADAFFGAIKATVPQTPLPTLSGPR